MTLMCDPPSGWRYGWPKPVPPKGTDMKKYFLDNGYPQKLVDQGMLKHVRYFEGETYDEQA